ncbi:hypothetical protein [uncultured Psychroserpens sp.]|uniref:hypothetical protein n=1 Tax=uncultured Psychroserpens sp. TaxID=255436 RepID=UPI0026156D0F|nr:hypothetical protein [uncultured Psychroserpens sp.]
MSHKICVIGCGWLGFPLAKKLVESHFIVHGSTTSFDKMEKLKKANIIPFLIEFTSDGIQGDIKACLSGCHTLVLNIPPGLRKNPESNYVQNMKQLIPHIETSSVENVLFIGSTSVYDDQYTSPVITEMSKTSSDPIALKLLEVEALFQNNKTFKTTLLRFSGLFAKDRHPATFLSGRKELKNGSSPVNLIHRTDCIEIILLILKQNIWNIVFNASTTPHPSKQEYYTRVCEDMDIPIPEFKTDTADKGKIINSEKLVHLLNYDFQVKL